MNKHIKANMIKLATKQDNECARIIRTLIRQGEIMEAISADLEAKVWDYPDSEMAINELGFTATSRDSNIERLMSI